MQSNTPKPHPTHSRSMTEEADIGSGEKTPGQLETDNIVTGIAPQGTDGNSASDTSRTPHDRGTGPGNSADVERGAEHASENDRAGHGQIQREQGRSRQDADPDGMTPDAAV